MSEPGPLSLRRGGSRYDRWRARNTVGSPASRVVDVAAPALVTLLAALARFWDLGRPHAIVFDETYYVKDAWSQWNLGYPANWPDGADAALLDGNVDGFLTTGSFAVHPPLGKWLIGAGMWLVGPDNPAGWRLAGAVAGTALVLLVYLVAKTMTGSTPVATLAALLLAVDGLAIVTSRVALLDVFLAVFVLLAFWFVLLDRRRHLPAVAGPPESGRVEGVGWGPLRWNRPWLIAAGAAAGAATAVKWSGLYVLAAIGIYVVVVDALERRRRDLRWWPWDALRQAAAAFVLLVPVAALTYLVSWTGWLVSDGGYGRHPAGDGPAGALSALWQYHAAMYRFHVGLSTPHSYESPAWQWPLLIRPTSMYWHEDGGTVQAISSIPNPLIWWGGIAAAGYLLYRFVRRRDRDSAFVLTGVGATFLPWLLYPERTTFQFYTIVMLPFLVLAAALAMRDLADGPGTVPQRRMAGQRTVLVLVALALALSAFWYPVWSALPVPYVFWRLHNWLPTWV